MKRRFLAALAASTLLVALSAPAFAQAVADDGALADDSDETNTEVQYVDCSQVQSAFASQGQYGDANAAADDESEATAEIAQDLGISQNQVNECLGGAADSTPDADENDTTDNGTTDKNDDENLKEGKDDVIEGTESAATLPKTGGPSLLLVGGGLAVLAGGAALIRRR